MVDAAPLIGIRRLKIKTDGQGITTLVAFHGCPLRCRYCLNPHSIAEDTRVMSKTPQEVMQVLQKDELYFRATGGGATFGGGEPMIRSQFIKDVMELGAKDWHTTIETSLNVPREHIDRLLPYIDEYMIDIKDMNAQTYMNYTTRGNQQVVENLKYLIAQGLSSSIVCRIPLIPDFNNTLAIEHSKAILTDLGVSQFDVFEYTTKHLDIIHNKD